MRDTEIDSVIENLVAIMPIFHKRILRMDLGGTTGDLTRLHLGIMAQLRTRSMTASELARLSVVPRPQMTHLINQLIKSSIVERHPDSKDRRVANISLTEHGRTLLEETRQKVQETMRKELAALTQRELTEMTAALETLRRIGARLQVGRRSDAASQDPMIS